MKKEIILSKNETVEEKKQECPYCHQEYKRVILKASVWEMQSMEPFQEDRNITVMIRCVNVGIGGKGDINQEKDKLKEYVNAEFKKGVYGYRELDCNESRCPYCNRLQLV